MSRMQVPRLLLWESVVMRRNKIYLVRHGEIVTGGGKRFIGQIDLPLSDTGVRQATRLRDRLAGLKFVRIFCSDLVRSIATARTISQNRGLEPFAVKGLREINMGLWEGLTFDEVRRSYPGEFEKRGSDIVNYRRHGGESFAHCALRVMAALDVILAATCGDILIAGHAGVNRIIISRVLGMPMENIFRIAQDYGCLNILAMDGTGFRLEALNHTF